MGLGPTALKLFEYSSLVCLCLCASSHKKGFFHVGVYLACAQPTSSPGVFVGTRFARSVRRIVEAAHGLALPTVTNLKDYHYWVLSLSVLDFVVDPIKIFEEEKR